MKPREYWLLPHHNDIDTLRFILEAPKDDEALVPSVGVHVIEISAYQALEARHKKLLEALKKLADRHNWSPDLGDCICQQHLDAYQIIEADEKASESC